MSAVRRLSVLVSGWMIAIYVIFAFAILIVWIIGSSADADAEYERSCASMGGHLHEIYGDDLCLSPDGRVLEP